MSPNAGTLVVELGLTLRPSLLGLPSGIALSLLGRENRKRAPKKTQEEIPIQKCLVTASQKKLKKT